MKIIGLLSDTHGYMDEKILAHLAGCDEIWHAGDWGTEEVSLKLSAIALTRGVYGNIDGRELRQTYPEQLRFKCEGIDVYIVHIGGYPGHYSPAAKRELQYRTPDLFICGHSHILKVMRDPKMNNMLHINPGAAGTHGFHKVRTLVRFRIEGRKIFQLEVIELGLRAALDAGIAAGI
jgi:putative phosphoesterase